MSNRRAHNLRYFAKIFGATLHKREFTGPYAKDDDDEDDRRLNINALTDEQLATLADMLDDSGETDIDEGGNPTRNIGRHQLDKLTDLVVESTGGQWSRPQALHHLMNTAHGAALAQRLKRAITKRKETNKMSNMEKLEAYVKALTATC
jgi:hypothetical protein